MNSTRLNSLLDEAQALAIYAARAGKLPEDSRLFEVIDSMTQALQRGEHPPDAPLFAEMQKVSSAAGVTVAQLMNRETRLGRLRQGAAGFTPFLVGFMTLLLTLYLAFQSSELHKADLALREYQDLVSQRLQEKFYLAWRMYKYERVLDVKTPPLAQLDNYQKLVEEAQRLSTKTSAVLRLLEDSTVLIRLSQRAPCADLMPCRGLSRGAMRFTPAIQGKVSPQKRAASGGRMGRKCTLYAPVCDNRISTDSTTIRYVPDLFATHGWCWLQNLASILNGTTPSKACSTGSLSAEEEDKLQEVGVGSADFGSDCKAPSLPAANAKPATLQTKIDPDKHLLSVACFVRSIGITTDWSTYPYQQDSIYKTRNKVNLLVSWLLPCLYGLLGACVYVMRDLLRGNGESMVGGDVRIVDLLSLLLRFALGGLAGIIVGWFSVPTGGASAIAVSSIPFGIAFLAGYSIESLFALLDRLVKSIGQRDEKKPADAAK